MSINRVFTRSRTGLTAAALLAALAGGANGDTIRLNSGAVIEGSIVKRTERKVWIDVGPTLVELAVGDIASIESAAAEVESEMSAESLFHTANNPPELSPHEHAKRIGPAVIKVATPMGLGSGVIINADGYALTNAHVIQGETALKVTVWFPEPDGTLKRTVIDDIEIIAVNSHVDIALIKLEHPNGEPFIFAPLEGAERVEVGQTVFAIGNPLGLERSLSQGVVSTKRRSFEGVTYIQTDTAVNPGNSGGPLFNTRGEVIGITNMGMLFSEGLNFAIPARYVKDVIRNREAFAYDKDNPNSGHHYHQPPSRKRFGVAPQLEDGTGGT